MPLFDDLLLRLRRIWTPPGAVVGKAGVPDDPAHRLAAELEEVLEALAGIEAEGQGLARAAEIEAAELIAAARADAARIVREAELGAPSARKEAAGRRLVDRSREIEASLSDAELESARLRELAGARVERMARLLLDRLFAEAGVPAGESGERIVGRG